MCVTILIGDQTCNVSIGNRTHTHAKKPLLALLVNGVGVMARHSFFLTKDKLKENTYTRRQQKTDLATDKRLHVPLKQGSKPATASLRLGTTGSPAISAGHTSYIKL